MRSFDADEVTADQHAVDVDRKDTSVDRFEARDVAHSANEQLGAHEVIEDLLGTHLCRCGKRAIECRTNKRARRAKR